MPVSWKETPNLGSTVPKYYCGTSLILTGVFLRSQALHKTYHSTKPACFPHPPPLCWTGLRLPAIYPLQTLLVKRVGCFVFKALSLRLCLCKIIRLLFQLQGCLGSSQSVTWGVLKPLCICYLAITTDCADLVGITTQFTPYMFPLLILHHTGLEI